MVESQGQILEKLAETLRPTVVKAVVLKPPERYKHNVDIRLWLSQYDTDLSESRVEQWPKARYLLTNPSSEAYAQVSNSE